MVETCGTNVTDVKLTYNSEWKGEGGPNSHCH